MEQSGCIHHEAHNGKRAVGENMQEELKQLKKKIKEQKKLVRLTIKLARFTYVCIAPLCNLEVSYVILPTIF